MRAGVVVVLSAAAFAVGGGEVSAQPIPAGVKVGLVRYLQAGYEGMKSNLLAAAEKMPEADYGFKPGSMPDVRTFGQLFAHVADGQSDVCATVSGVPNPNAGKDLVATLKTKADVVNALTQSFEVCDGLFASLTDATAGEFVKRGQGEIVKSALLVGLLAHNAEMYGISTVYLRAKNLVPPSTERQQRRRRGGGR